MFWFDKEGIIPGNLGFAVSVCRLRERGRMSRLRVWIHVRVFHDLEFVRYGLRCVIERQLKFSAGMNKVYCYCKMVFVIECYSLLLSGLTVL